MRTVGIVCEYNPFHRGHLYQMEESRRLCEDALIVCALSGDFVQRGEKVLVTFKIDNSISVLFNLYDLSGHYSVAEGKFSTLFSFFTGLTERFPFITAYLFKQ